MNINHQLFSEYYAMLVFSYFTCILSKSKKIGSVLESLHNDIIITALLYHVALTTGDLGRQPDQEDNTKEFSTCGIQYNSASIGRDMYSVSFAYKHPIKLHGVSNCTPIIFKLVLKINMIVDII